MIKYVNLLILLILLTFGFLLKNQMHLSTNLLSLFATQESINKFNIANHLGYSKEMFIAIKGYDRNSKREVKEISKELTKIKYIEYVQSNIIPTREIQNYYKQYYPIISTFHPFDVKKEKVAHKLQELYNAQFSTIFYTSIDRYDPLGMFHLNAFNGSTVTHKGDLITLGSYGYLIRVMTNVTPSKINKSKELYSDVQSLLSSYPNAVAFAPFFYTVENSTAIQADVQWIVILSTIVLLLLYYVLIKNIGLLFQTLLTLMNSMLFAGMISMLFVENFNVLSLAFGMSLSAVSIDYLLHYYFHNFYENSMKIDKNVLYGYLTTIVAFGIFSFIPIPLIAQISIFAVLSLSFAYVIFTFIFPKLHIKKYVQRPIRKKQIKFPKVPASIVFILSLLLLFYSGLYFNLDKNIRNLDYQNKHLKNIEHLFKVNMKSNLKPIVVNALSQDELLQHLHEIQITQKNSFSLASFIKDKESCDARKKELKNYDFTTIKSYIKDEATQIGFKKNYFDDAYNFVSGLPSCEPVNLNIFQIYGLSIYHDKKQYYTIAFVDNEQQAKKFIFVSSLNAKEMFNNSVQYMYDKLVKYALVVLLMIFILLLLSVQKRFIYAVNYILFPVGLTLAILVSIGDINIMHLFSLIILIAIGIDYGIYMSNSEKRGTTMIAIHYSLLSTFAAFGVLILSTIMALHSIGIVITLGCGAIFILIKVMK